MKHWNTYFNSTLNTLTTVRHLQPSCKHSSVNGIMKQCSVCTGKNCAQGKLVISKYKPSKVQSNNILHTQCSWSMIKLGAELKEVTQGSSLFSEFIRGLGLIFFFLPNFQHSDHIPFRRLAKIMLNKLVISKQLILLQENEPSIIIYNNFLCKTSPQFKLQPK